MQLTLKQEEGLRIAVDRYKHWEPYTCIGGFAGSGKTTLLRYIIEALGLDPEEDVAYITFTGKAATVLQHSGCPNAMTAHKFLFHAKPLPNGGCVFKPKVKLDQYPKVVVVDEISMLPKDLWELLLSHHIYVIACGDPFQLPPIYKDTDNHVLDKPHIFLDEIMRQAQESEIIRASMAIRNYNALDLFKGKEVQVLSIDELSTGMMLWADQIITATNKTRTSINSMVRQALNRGAAPEHGDKVICCRNSWEIVDDNLGNSLVNGTIGYLCDPTFSELNYPKAFKLPSVPLVDTHLVTDANERFSNLRIDKKTIEENVKTLSPQQEFFASKKLGFAPLEFNYGYAITCHRAQGSQWNKVLVIEESFPFAREEHARWLYTAITRASDKLVLIR